MILTMTENRVPLDAYYSDKRLASYLYKHLPIINNTDTIFEPCVGEGALLHNETINITNDINPLVIADFHYDMTIEENWLRVLQGRSHFDFVVTNPPYNQANIIVPLCFKYSTICAVLMRLSFLEPVKDRSEFFLSTQRYLERLIIFNPRPRYINSKGTDNVTSYWMIWNKNKTVSNTDIIFATDWKGI